MAEEKKIPEVEEAETAKVDEMSDPAEASEQKEPQKEAKKSKKEATILKKEQEKLQKEYDELNEKYTRMIAEYDNYRKRSAKEREGVYADAYIDALKEILPIKDTLELALAYSEAEKFKEGVEMTLNKFTDSLTKMGVEPIGEEGQQFDPNIHNAIMHIEDENYGENEIVAVLQKGYKKGDKILRYAMVKVAN